MKTRFLLPALAAVLLCSAAVPAAHAAANGFTPGSFQLAADDSATDDSSLNDMFKGDRGGERGEKWKAEMEKMKDMSPEEREAHKQELMADKKKKMEERISQLPPEQQDEARKRMEEFEAKRKAMHDELMALPPEERAKRMKEMGQQMRGQNDGKRMERMKENWGKASPEEKQAFCARVSGRCADMMNTPDGGGDAKAAGRGGRGGGGMLCEKAKTLCADSQDSGNAASGNGNGGGKK